MFIRFTTHLHVCKMDVCRKELVMFGVECTLQDRVSQETSAEVSTRVPAAAPEQRFFQLELLDTGS